MNNRKRYIDINDLAFAIEVSIGEINWKLAMRIARNVLSATESWHPQVRDEASDFRDRLAEMHKVEKHLLLEYAEA